MSTENKELGVPASPSGHQPSASATSADAPVSSQSGVPNAGDHPFGRYLQIWEARALGYDVAHALPDGRVRSMETPTGYSVVYGAPSYCSAVERIDKLLKWSIPVNLRWLAEQGERPDRVPCGVLTGRFLLAVAEEYEAWVASGMSAFGQDAQRLEAKPASPTGEAGDAHEARQ